MLHKQTVTTELFDILIQLMKITELENFALVGGTNLSLRFGYRMSVDVDLFTNEELDLDEISNAIIQSMPQAIKLNQKKQTLWFMIDGVKIDILLHKYQYIYPIQIIDNIRFLSVPDIIPMKLEAMATRGVKKDFWDIAELLNYFIKFSLSQNISIL